MIDRSARLEGLDWQIWAKKLLSVRYPAGDFQEIPDKDRGDGGIEGFSLDGRVYQMYGPEGELTFEQRHDKIRNKMTTDISKFINNKVKLSKMLGSLLVKRWILLVPSFDSRSLVEHAAKKTSEVLEAKLAYVDAHDFRVVVLAETAFAAERAQLLELGVAKIDVCAKPATDDEADGWTLDQGNEERLSNLQKKVRKLPTLASDEERAEFRREAVKWWLDGQNVLEGLREYPDAWESIRRVKSEQEKYLKGHGMMANGQPHETLMNALRKIGEAVEQEVCALAVTAREAVSHEAVADWLMRCPLDFPESRCDG